MQPGRDGGLTAEGMSSSVCGDQGVLDGISGLLTVAQSTQGDRPETVAMTPNKLTEGVRVACDMSSQELLVAHVADCPVVQR